MSIRFLHLSALVLLLGTAACASTSPYAGMGADELFALGRQEFEEEDWNEAAEVLDHLLLRVADQTFAQGPEARYMLAQAYFNKEEYLTAQSEFVRFTELYPGHELRPRAALGACRSAAERSPIPERDQTPSQQAAITCATVVQEYGGVVDEVAQEAQAIANRMRAKLGESLYLTADHYMNRDFLDSAIIYFEEVVERFGDTVWAPRAIAGMIEAYEEIGYDEEVREWTRTLLDSYPDSPEARAIVNGVPPDTSVVGG